MHELLMKATATDGLLFLLSVIGYTGSPWRSGMEAFWGCAATFTLLAGIPLVIAVIWTG